MDVTTGLQYTDKYGQTPVQNQNLAQIAASDTAIRQALLAKLGTSDADRRAAVSGQAGQVASLDRTISGGTPSVAAGQLQESLGQIQRSQLAMAAGASGSNAFAARRQAAANIGQADLMAAQAAGIQRAKEIQDAQTLKANVLANMSGTAIQKYGADVEGAHGFDKSAQDAQTTTQTLDTQAGLSEQQREQQRQSALLGAGTSLGVGLIGSLGKKKSSDE